MWNLAPFTSKDFTIRGLADRVKDLQSLVYLYPDTPKAQAFAKYYSPASGKSNSRTDTFLSGNRYTSNGDKPILKTLSHVSAEAVLDRKMLYLDGEM